MKTLLNLKQGDLFIQAVAFIIPIVGGIAIPDSGFFLLAYFTVGGAQALSVIGNLFLPGTFRAGARKYAEVILGALILGYTLAVVYTSLEGIYFLISLLFISPVIAIWYAWLSYHEMMKVKKHADRKKYVLTN